MKTIFFFLTPLITISLFCITQDYNPLSEIVISTENGEINHHDYVQLNFLDGHNLKLGNGWRDLGYSNGTHIWLAGMEGSKDPFEIYQKAYAPTYGYSASTSEFRITTTGVADATCNHDPYTKSTNPGPGQLIVQESDAAAACAVVVITWDISTISVFSTITDTSFRYDITAVSLPRNCDYTEITNNPTTASAATLWDDIVNTSGGSTYVTNTANCTTVANNYVDDLGALADANVQVNLVNGWFAVGLKANNMVRSPDDHSSTWSTILGDYELQITYNSGAPPSGGSDCEDPITTLHYTTVTNTSAALAWTAPAQNSVTITGYQINYTTPFGIPLSIRTNNTNSTTTSYSVPGLTYNTPYSFRVQPWTNSTCHSPADGNIINVFTNPTVTPGSLDTGSFNATNPLAVPCTFTRTDINSTSLLLNVTYPNTYDPSINFHYKYAMTNNTYTGFASSIVDSNYNMSSFQFNGVDNEIIDVLFTDQNTNDTCKYLITQTNFKLLELVNNFNNGDYGTRGQFGVFDIGTLIIIILAMIGFNRVNESVGYVFAIAIIAITAALGFITWPTIIVAALAMIGLYAVASTKKD